MEGRQLKNSWILGQSAPRSMWGNCWSAFKSTTPGTLIAVYMVRKRKRKNPIKCLEQKSIISKQKIRLDYSPFIVLSLKMSTIKDEILHVSQKCRQDRCTSHKEANWSFRELLDAKQKDTISQFSWIKYTASLWTTENRDSFSNQIQLIHFSCPSNVESQNPKEYQTPEGHYKLTIYL